MRKHIILNFKSLFFLIASTLIFSCSEEEFLVDLDPNSVPSTIFAENIREVEASLASVYEGLRGHRVADVGPGNLISDITFPGKRNTSGQFFQHIDFITYTLNPTSQELSRRWSQLYQIIFNANLTLRFVESGRENELDESELLVIEAQAKFLRGLAHFYLYTTFNEGNIIVRMNTNQKIENLGVNVTPAAQVIEIIREDLDFAYKNLPQSNTTDYPKGRVTAAAAAIVLGNSYLYENKFDEAIPFYEELVNESPKFGLSLLSGKNELLNMFADSGQFNSENIFEIVYTTGINLQQTQWEEDSFHNRLAKVIGPPTGNSDGAIVPSNWLLVEYLQDHIKFTDADLQDPSVYTTVSLRASAMTAMVHDTINPYYQSDFAAQHYSFLRQPAFFRKYTNWDNSSSEINSEGAEWKSGKNVVLNRLPEAYLNLAECYLKGSAVQVSRAIDLINVIRERWQVAPYKLDPSSTKAAVDQVMEHIMFVEKPLELSLEGSHARIIDLRRWGIAKQRFEALSSNSDSTIRNNFRLAPYEYTTVDNKVETRLSSLLLPLQDGEVVEENNMLEVEFFAAAANYTNGYYPLPTIETDFNENIK